MAHWNVSNSKEQILNETAIYTGEIRTKDGKPDGYGKAVYPNGDKFCGIFSKGDPIVGIYTFDNGSYCKVRYEYNFSRTRYTKYYVTSDGYDFRKARFETREDFSNGYYKGETKNGMRHGIGVYVWKDGTSYNGGWLNNQKHGVGIYVYSDGDYDWSVWNKGKEVCVLSRYRKSNQTTPSYAYDSCQDSDVYSGSSSDQDSYSRTDDLFYKALDRINYGTKEEALSALKELRSECGAEDYVFEDMMGHQINIDQQIEETENSRNEDDE